MDVCNVFWRTLFVFCTKRKLLWFIPLIYHIPSLIMLPTIDGICDSARNTTVPLDDQLSQTLRQDGYKILIQIFTYAAFTFHLYILVCAYREEKEGERLIQRLTKINHPFIKSLETWRIVRFEKPFNNILYSRERTLVMTELSCTLLLLVRFYYIVTCGLAPENETPDWTLSTLRYVLARDNDDMPNAKFAYTNFLLVTGLYFLILLTVVAEMIAVSITLLTPLRASILASLCEGEEGKSSAYFVANELEYNQVWTLCVVGHLSPKHFTHAVAVIRKELHALERPT